jgi:hypothetical protein
MAVVIFDRPPGICEKGRVPFTRIVLLDTSLGKMCAAEKEVSPGKWEVVPFKDPLTFLVYESFVNSVGVDLAKFGTMEYNRPIECSHWGL